jgi:hypothetical protein
MRLPRHYFAPGAIQSYPRPGLLRRLWRRIRHWLSR